MMPFEGKQTITQLFSAKHNGLDIFGLDSDNVFAVASGRVLLARKDKVYGYGNRIAIEDELGNCWIYAHLSSIMIDEGAYVKAGQIIGLQGSTGNSTGKHLHLGLFEKGDENKPLNPAIALNIVKPVVGMEINYEPEETIEVRVVKRSTKSITVEYEGLKGILK